jgi:hypothetical protein
MPNSSRALDGCYRFLRLHYGKSGGRLQARATDDRRHADPFSHFSQMVATNAKEDRSKNCLVRRCANWVKEFAPKIFVMENLPEMLSGRLQLRRLGYRASKETAGKTGTGCHAQQGRPKPSAGRPSKDTDNRHHNRH